MNHTLMAAKATCTILLLMISATCFGQAACDPDFVEVGSTLITVSPTGDDDTANLQCAMDLAVDNSVPTVKLKPANYAISHLSVAGFEGALEGLSRTSTKLSIIEGGMDCPAELAEGRLPAAIRFVGGRPTLRYMKIEYESPCTVGNAEIAIAFTGRPNQGQCGNDVIFGEVDRVDLVRLSERESSQWPHGIRVGAERLSTADCFNLLSGTFKLNQSTIDGFRSGIHTEMKAQSPVEIRFSEFMGNQSAIRASSANQDLTIASNIIDSSVAEGDTSNGYGILVSSGSFNVPAINAVRIHRNQFIVDDMSQAVVIVHHDIQVTVSAVISENQFQLVSSKPYNPAISVQRVDGGRIFGNRFTGVFAPGPFDLIDFVGFSSNEVFGWSVMDNQFNGGSIVLYPYTGNIVVGPDQGVTVNDRGIGNFVLQ